MEVKDIKLDSGDLLFENGDFVISESDAQHQQDIIVETLGSYKYAPLIGVGITRYLNSSGMELILSKSIKSQLEADGYNVERIKFDGRTISEFTVEATRKRN